MNFYTGKDNLGDLLLMEPVLEANSRELGKPVKLFVTGPARELFENNPYITLIDLEYGYSVGLHDWPEREFKYHTDYLGNQWLRLDPCSAFVVAHQNEVHFTKAYFIQLGLDHTINTKPKLYYDLKDEPNEYIVVAPFSRSCMSNLGGIANKTIELSWWEVLVEKLPYEVISLGSEDEPELKGTTSWRGKSLKEVADLCKNSKLVITVETSILVIGDAVGSKIVSLNCATPPYLVEPSSEHITISAIGPTWKHKDVLKAVEDLL